MDISAEQAERFGTLMRKNLTSGDIPFRKAYLGAIIDRVEVDDGQIRIVGRKDVLEQAVLANGVVTPGVRSFVRKWRARRDFELLTPKFVDWRSYVSLRPAHSLDVTLR